VRFAVEASEVQEIRNSDERNQLHKPKGTELIDFAQRLGLGPGILERFVVLKPGECALGVSEVERMTSLPKAVALPRLFSGAERQWYRGLLLLENEVVPLLRTEYWRKPPLPAQGSESGV
jgi:hypothetical protein